MATAPEWQGKGVGTSVLAAVVKYVAEAGGGLFWCNARLPAVGFYEQAGMSTTGEPWEEPVIGPHIAMLKMVDPAAAHGHRA
jgi:GNAT superfamily N-acetyltransferase